MAMHAFCVKRHRSNRPPGSPNFIKKQVLSCTIEIISDGFSTSDSDGDADDRQHARRSQWARSVRDARAHRAPPAQSVKMADARVLISQPQNRPIRIREWKVHVGSAVSIGRVILLYDFDEPTAAERRKLKSTVAGTVHQLLAPEGAVVPSGEPLIRLNACIHPTVMKDMCAECGADLRKEAEAACTSTASVPMVHAIPELKVSEEVAQKLGRADGERLIRDRKLVLLVDLDQTLIHTTNDNVPPNLRDVHHFQLYGPASPWYHTRLRPGTHAFLKNIAAFFELHICTFGARNYAHQIAAFLDGDQTFFSNRILSRDECFDPTSKKANLKALFPCGDDMVCIIDDREDVWNHATNLIHVKPYHFFKHTGDINAPPGLEKLDAADSKGVDLTDLKRTKLNGNACKEAVAVDAKLVDEAPRTEVLTDNDNVDITTSDKENTLKEHSKTDTNDDGAVTAKETDSEAAVNTSEELNYSEVQIKDTSLVESTNNEVQNEDPQESKDDERASTVVTPPTEEKPAAEDDVIDVDDPDDYLLHLEDILKLVHKRFYEEYDNLEAGRVPDLKIVIPSVRGEVLKGAKLVFSGLVPTHIRLEQSKAYQVARSLGAVVTQDIDDATTHLVAVRPGTAKVNAGRRRKHLKIVTPDWLWTCAERWERVAEAIYPLSGKGSKNRHPPPHCSSPDHAPNYPVHEQPAARRRTPSGRFMDTINPLMSFSRADIADMDKEVEDILDDDSDSDNDGGDRVARKTAVEEEGQDEEDDDTGLRARLMQADEEDSSSSSDESLTAEYPRGFKRTRTEERTEEDEREPEEAPDGNNKDDDDDDDDYPSAKFRRGEQLDSDMESEGSDEPADEVDDGEWNMMGAALEREFLSNN